MQKITYFLLIAFFSQNLLAGNNLASQEKFYYGEDLNSLVGQDLKESLHKVLDAHHISHTDNYDEIVDACPINENDNCYAHRELSYKTARENLFGFLHLEGESPSKYYVTSLYCLKEISNAQLPSEQSLGPGKIPSAHVINTEHTWPQSHFTTKFPKTLQKGDLHALFPVLMQVNSTRGNHPFGIVDDITAKVCAKAMLGKNHKGETVFEPADEVKGDVARASFYFSVRYNTRIDATEEAVLREWHKQDPINRHEQWRNEEVFHIQHIRNPFVDKPEWVDSIRDF